DLKIMPDLAAAQTAFETAIPMGRCGAPEDVASAALYLASDAAKWVTGAEFVVDGGYTAV
ncbi:MAG: SDR family oxidoreductase, partial [Methylibium sp.]|nr:SDR family oxidoreductase [Methylibium sp.]